MQETPSKNESWLLIRQAIVFQLKLSLDALRDILMSPVSIVLLIADIVISNNHQQSYFIRLMRLGKKSDDWINLFGVDSSSIKLGDNKTAMDSNVDYWFTKIEEVIKKQHLHGKLSQSEKDKLKQYVAQMNQPSNKVDDMD